MEHSGPAPEGAGKDALLGVVQGHRDLGKRHVAEKCCILIVEDEAATAMVALTGVLKGPHAPLAGRSGCFDRAHHRVQPPWFWKEASMIRDIARRDLSAT
jgi:hypothetical protein